MSNEIGSLSVLGNAAKAVLNSKPTHDPKSQKGIKQNINKSNNSSNKSQKLQGIRLKFGSLPTHLFVEKWVDIQLFLFDGETLKTGEDVLIRLGLFLGTDAKDLIDESSYQIESSTLNVGKTGMGTTRFRILEPSTSFSNKEIVLKAFFETIPFDISLLQTQGPLISAPMTSIRHKLAVKTLVSNNESIQPSIPSPSPSIAVSFSHSKAHQVPPSLSSSPSPSKWSDGKDTYIWFKDESGKDNCIDLQVCLLDSEERLVLHRYLPLKLTLVYGASGEPVSRQDLLSLSPESKLFINSETGMAQIKFRINDVSKNHQRQSFSIKVSPGMGMHGMRGAASSSSTGEDEHQVLYDVSSAVTSQIEVKSKRTKEARHNVPQPGSTTSTILTNPNLILPSSKHNPVSIGVGVGVGVGPPLGLGLGNSGLGSALGLPHQQFSPRGISPGCNLPQKGGESIGHVGSNKRPRNLPPTTYPSTAPLTSPPLSITFDDLQGSSHSFIDSRQLGPSLTSPSPSFLDFPVLSGSVNEPDSSRAGFSFSSPIFPTNELDQRGNVGVRSEDRSSLPLHSPFNELPLDVALNHIMKWVTSTVQSLQTFQWTPIGLEKDPFTQTPDPQKCIYSMSNPNDQIASLLRGYSDNIYDSILSLVKVVGQLPPTSVPSRPFPNIGDTPVGVRKKRGESMSDPLDQGGLQCKSGESISSFSGLGFLLSSRSLDFGGSEYSKHSSHPPNGLGLGLDLGLGHEESEVRPDSQGLSLGSSSIGYIDTLLAASRDEGELEREAEEQKRRLTERIEKETTLSSFLPSQGAIPSQSTIESKVHFILSSPVTSFPSQSSSVSFPIQNAVNSISIAGSFPAFDQDHNLVGFYRESQDTQRATIILFEPLDRSLLNTSSNPLHRPSQLPPSPQDWEKVPSKLNITAKDILYIEDQFRRKLSPLSSSGQSSPMRQPKENRNESKPSREVFSLSDCGYDLEKMKQDALVQFWMSEVDLFRSYDELDPNN